MAEGSTRWDGSRPGPPEVADLVLAFGGNLPGQVAGRDRLGDPDRRLKREGIGVTSERLGGTRGRRIQFWPGSGRARRSFMAMTEPAPPPRLRPVPTSGILELF